MYILHNQDGGSPSYANFKFKSFPFCLSYGSFSANVSLLVSQQPAILLEDMDKIRDRAEQLKGLLETDEIDRAVELNPTFLDLAQVRSAMKEIKRLMPKQNAAKVLLLNPSMLFSMQTGENLIPYDNGTAKQLKASLTGGEDAAPKGW